MNEKGSATILTLLVSAVILTVAIGFNWLVKEHLKAAEGLKTKTEAMMQARSAYDSLIFYILSSDYVYRFLIMFSIRLDMQQLSRVKLKAKNKNKIYFLAYF